MFGTVFAIIRVVVQLLPMIRDIIAVAETAFPTGGSGVQKLELVRVLLQSAYDAEQKIEAPFGVIWPTINAVISHLVASDKVLAPVEDHSTGAGMKLPAM